MKWTVGRAIEVIMEMADLNQGSFAKKLEVTPGYVSNIVTGRNEPSTIFIKAICYEFGVNRKWVETGKGDPFTDKSLSKKFKIEKRKPKTRNSLLALAVLSTPVMPAVGAGLVIGVGASEIIDRMKDSFGAKTVSELARNHLNVDRTAISHWIKDNRIPTKHIAKTLENEDIHLEDLLLSKNDLKSAADKISNFTKKQVLKDREKRINIDKIYGEVLNEFNIIL
jgi:transcriptional regulator with XRE-family HTH domain